MKTYLYHPGTCFEGPDIEVPKVVESILIEYARNVEDKDKPGFCEKPCGEFCELKFFDVVNELRQHEEQPDVVKYLDRLCNEAFEPIKECLHYYAMMVDAISKGEFISKHPAYLYDNRGLDEIFKEMVADGRISIEGTWYESVYESNQDPNNEYACPEFDYEFFVSEFKRDVAEGIFTYEDLDGAYDLDDDEYYDGSEYFTRFVEKCQSEDLDRFCAQFIARKPFSYQEVLALCQYDVESFSEDLEVKIVDEYDNYEVSHTNNK